MTDRTKITLAAIVCGTVLAVTLLVVLIPRRHVVEVEGGGAFTSSPDPESEHRVIEFVKRQIAEAEAARNQAADAGNTAGVAALDASLADMRKQLAEYEAGIAKRK